MSDDTQKGAVSTGWVSTTATAMELHDRARELAAEMVEEQEPPGMRFVGEPEAVSAMMTAIAVASLNYGELVKDVTGRTGNQEYKYATLSSLIRATREPLAREGITINQPITQGPRGKHRLWTIFSGLGARWETWLDFDPRSGDDPKEGIKGYGKYTTYLRRYTYQAAVVLDGERDADDDANVTPGPAGGRPQQRQQPPKPNGGQRQQGKPATPPQQRQQAQDKPKEETVGNRLMREEQERVAREKAERERKATEAAKANQDAERNAEAAKAAEQPAEAAKERPSARRPASTPPAAPEPKEDAREAPQQTPNGAAPPDVTDPMDRETADEGEVGKRIVRCARELGLESKAAIMHWAFGPDCTKGPNDLSFDEKFDLIERLQHAVLDSQLAD